MNIEMEKVVPISKLSGEDAEETKLLKKNLTSALNFIQSHNWCKGVDEVYFGGGVGGIFTIFLMKVAMQLNSEWLWVVDGDLPSCYFVTDDAKNPKDASSVYCELMLDWVHAVRSEMPMSSVFPISAESSKENADALSKRISLIKEEIIPVLFD